MKEIIMTTAMVLIALVLVLASSSLSLAKTQVYQLRDDPFTFSQCYDLGSWLQGPADYFGESVCVDYQALNSVTTRIQTNNDGTQDVGWNLIQNGTATVKSKSTGNVRYVGPFHVEEVAQDDGNNADCLGTDRNGNPVAWLGHCWTNIWTTLDFARYHWKITGNKIYFYEYRVTEPGKFCYLDDRGVIFDGGGCPPGQ